MYLLFVLFNCKHVEQSFCRQSTSLSNLQMVLSTCIDIRLFIETWSSRTSSFIPRRTASASICINEMQNASTSMTTCAVEAMLRCLLICSLDWYGLVPPMQQHLDAAGIGWLQALRGPNGQKNKSSESRSNRMQRFVSSFFEFRWRSLTSVPAAFVAGSPLPRVLWELRHTWLLSFCSLAMTRFESARDVGSWWLIPKLFGYRKLLLRLDIHILLQASSTTNF